MNLTNDPGDDVDASWSPDGSRIAFTRVPLEKEEQNMRFMGAPEIYVMNADGSGAINISNHEMSDTQPTWSPDGKRIAFVSNREGWRDGLFIMNADGSDANLLLGPWDSTLLRPLWSPLGGSVLVVAEDGGDRSLYVVQPDGSAHQELSSGGSCGAWGLR